MGCIGSHLSHLIASDSYGRENQLSSRRRNVFAVLNVDDLGRHISPGKLEVSERDLTLHINGRPSLVWPLRCLRRYGYENDLFSFEAGRRCPTGPGIYAFKCSMAQTLFELLQAKIQGNPGAQPIIPHNPRHATMSSASAHANLSPISLSPTFDYVNIDETQDEQLRQRNNSATGDDLINTEDNGQHPLYVNIDNTNTAPSILTTTSNGNLSKLRNGLPLPSHDQPSVLYTNIIPTHRRTLLSDVNYAELDLEQSGSSDLLHQPIQSLRGIESPLPFNSRVVSSTTSVTSRTVTLAESATSELGYATIDFDRTAALSVVTRSKIKLDFGSSTEREEESEEVATTVIRKTRHNSTVL